MLRSLVYLFRSFSSVEIVEALYTGIDRAAKEANIFIAAQCCEHLNRAIVAEADALPCGTETVNAVPQPKAGGSMAYQAYMHFENPAVVEEIKADAGIDIGFTLIGMHLKKIAVPLRLENNRIGCATVLAARTRPKFIGGSRAVYNDDLL